MKTKFLIPALLIMGMTTAPMMVSAESVKAPMMLQQQDSVKIQENQLPQQVRSAISDDQELSGMTISEAWRSTKDGETYYKVKFDKAGGEAVVKKFDSEGKHKDMDKDHVGTQAPTRNPGSSPSGSPGQTTSPSQYPDQSTPRGTSPNQSPGQSTPGQTPE
jgi:hypothetical protein